MDNQAVKKNRLIQANKVIIAGRWFYLSAIVITAIISRFFTVIFSEDVSSPNANFPPFLMFLFPALTYVLNIIYYFFFRRAEKSSLEAIQVMSFLQIFADQLIVTLVIYFAGGLTSIGFLYYFYSIIGSAFIYSFWGVAVLSLTASIFYSSMILLQLYNIIPFFSRYNLEFESLLAHNPAAAYTNLTAVITSFFIVGYFAGLIAKSMRKQENDIIAERDKGKAIISNLSDGLIYIASDNSIDLVNSRAEKMLSFRGRDVVGKKIKDINLNKQNLLGEVLKADSRVREFNFSDIKDNYLRVYTIEVKNDRKSLGIAKIIHDVSREKYVDKMKSEFITIAGHQLRTPLSAIKGALSLFISGDYGKINREQESMTKQSYDYTERLIKIVNDMLNVSSAEEGKFSYEFIKTNVYDFVEKNSSRFVDEANNKKISLLFNFADGLPPVELDQRKFRLVFNALLENALVYNKEGGKVQVMFDRKDEKLLITVHDTGIGIPKEVQEKVFTKFFRADNALKFFTEGNGLDLFVVKNIIDNHQGDIWFESEAGRGTTFFITIPFVQTKKGEIEK